ncbi:hypothetical protein [uncultured Kordia sp.]|uniref:hypothetical protein n=1 Tax=uncultured Kordia sp. TaxID=507699 RepID=UPI0026271F2A|nr:hypothetical protein [uncultured Kordia sp.]
MTEFTERYRKLSDEELLGIITSASSYQPIAIETAKLELLNRGIPEDELNELITQNREEAAERQKNLQEKKEASEAKKKAFFDPINPFLKGLESHERQIRILSWLLSGLGLYVAVLLIYIFIEGYALIHLFLSSILSVEFGKSYLLILYLIYIISTILGPILFWKRTRFGWFLSAFIIISSALGLILTVFYYASQPYYQFDEIVDAFMMSDTRIMIHLFYVSFVTFGLYVLFKRKVKYIFNVKKTIIWIAWITAIICQMLLWYPFLGN